MRSACAASASTCGSGCCQRYNSAGSSKARSTACTSSSSSRRDPRGISSRSANCTGATCSTRSNSTSSCQQFAIRFARGPGRERNEGGRERQTGGSKLSHHLDEIGARVAFVELREHRVIHRFHGAGDEQAAGFAQPRQQFAMLQQVFDLDGGVVGDARAIRDAARPRFAWRAWAR